MPYTVNFTDRENKTPITVFDNTSSTDTSISFPGRNVTGYGQIIAENFLHLLENFASANPPVNPVEGQLWYSTADEVLYIWDNTNWKAASNIQRSGAEPPPASSRNGELWVDTVSQQLYIFSGSRWILVGPNFSTGLRSGPIVESITDSDNNEKVILIFYVDDTPVAIVSKDSFTPKISIPGFTFIRPGMNITSENVGGTAFPTKLHGTATIADTLKIGDKNIEGSKFLRSDVVNSTDFELNIRSNSGINLGVDSTFNISNSAQGARIYNSIPGSSLDIQLNRGGIPNTTLRVVDGRIGINVLSPTVAVDIDGDVAATGTLVLTNTSAATNLNNGTFRTAGGAAISKNLIVGTELTVNGVSQTGSIIPNANNAQSLGSDPTTGGKRWNEVWVRTVRAETLRGTLEGNIVGNASTATSLQSTTFFNFSGDITLKTAPIAFDGSVGGNQKTFSTQLTSAVISDKPEVTQSIGADQVLVFRTGVGLLKQNRNNFVGDLAVPIGAILPFAGSIVPTGYLLCDGSEVERTRFTELYDVIGNTYGVPVIGVNTFKIPDLRGRFPLGRDNMDNGRTVPTTLGNFVDAGGGNVDRVQGVSADNVGQAGGFESNTLLKSNLPQHEHNMQGSTGTQYYATRLDTAVPLDQGSFSNRGPTLAGQMQYLPDSGGIARSPQLGQPFSVMNPFLTINYIIRSGPPNF
jgi:microcystin-dependent protein